jgi:DNA invertase Pin-like site-specific DNA recombinase
MISGKLPNRPRWDNCLDYLRPGDQLVIARLSRLFRSVRHLTELAADLDRRQVNLVVLKQGIDTSTPAGRLLFHMLGAIDEFTADLISEGTHAEQHRRMAGDRRELRPPPTAAR